jgi:hypothetical protein
MLGVPIKNHAFVFSLAPDHSTFLIPESVSQRFGRLVARLGIDTSIHALRHYNATELIAAGVWPPDAAYEVARTHAGKAALPLATTKTTIHKRLAEGHHLASVDKDQHTVVRTIAGKRRRVLHLHPEPITGSED